MSVGPRRLLPNSVCLSAFAAALRWRAHGPVVLTGGPWGWVGECKSGVLGWSCGGWGAVRGSSPWVGLGWVWVILVGGARGSVDRGGWMTGVHWVRRYDRGRPVPGDGEGAGGRARW